MSLLLTKLVRNRDAFRGVLVDVAVCVNHKPIQFLLLFLVLQLAGHWPAPPTKPLPPDPIPSESKMQCKVEGAFAAICHV